MNRSTSASSSRPIICKTSEGDLKYRYVGKKVEVLAKIQQDGHRLLLVVGKPKYIKVLKVEEAT